MILDVLFFGAHPDDVELTAGGTVAKLTRLNYRVGICDLTRGEAGTRGSAELRDREAEEAARLLGVAVRDNLSLPDAEFQNTPENRLHVIRILRKYRPDFVFAPYWDDRHPDHIHASDLVKESVFYSGLAKIVTDEDGQAQQAFRPKRVLYCPARYEFSKISGTMFIVDISDTFEIKMQAMAAFASQFYNPSYANPEPPTYISTPEFREAIEARARHFGALIDCRYGEPFLSKEYIGIHDPIRILRESGQDINKLGFA
jgi:bacillithiol biosynthesis deacetylase BshB1